MKSLFFVLVVLIFSSSLFAQFEKQLFFTFDTKDVNTIQINVADEYEVQSWDGDHVLVQENIQLYDATLNIFKYFVGEGRYDVVNEDVNGNIVLKSKDTKEYAIRTKNGECYEVVKLVILIPEEFDGADKNFQRKNILVD